MTAIRIRVYLERVKLDTGGYVRKGQALPYGQYYGVGQPLYYFQTEWDNPDGTGGRYESEFRADNRGHAIERVRNDWKSCFPADARLVFAGKW